MPALDAPAVSSREHNKCMATDTLDVVAPSGGIADCYSPTARMPRRNFGCPGPVAAPQTTPSSRGGPGPSQRDRLVESPSSLDPVSPPDVDIWDQLLQEVGDTYSVDNDDDWFYRAPSKKPRFQHGSGLPPVVTAQSALDKARSARQLPSPLTEMSPARGLDPVEQPSHCGPVSTPPKHLVISTGRGLNNAIDLNRHVLCSGCGVVYNCPSTLKRHLVKNSGRLSKGEIAADHRCLPEHNPVVPLPTDPEFVVLVQTGQFREARKWAFKSVMGFPMDSSTDSIDFSLSAPRQNQSALSQSQASPAQRRGAPVVVPEPPRPWPGMAVPVAISAAVTVPSEPTVSTPQRAAGTGYHLTLESPESASVVSCDCLLFLIVTSCVIIKHCGFLCCLSEH